MVFSCGIKIYQVTLSDDIHLCSISQTEKGENSLEFFVISNILKLTFVELRGNKSALVINTVKKLNLIVV
jgi:hypothetical protein